MKKTNFIIKVILIVVVSSFLTWSCQNEEINLDSNFKVDNFLSEEEWSAIKESEPFIASYNALSGMNFIIETTKLTYDELLEYAYNEKNRPKFKSKIESSGLTEYFVLNHTLSFDAALGVLFETNEKLKKSNALKSKVLNLLQLYSEAIEENIDDIAESYNEEVVNNHKLAARGSGSGPRIFRYIGEIGKNITIRNCFRRDGLIIVYGGRYLCVKDLYITLDEVIITGKIKRKRVKVDHHNRYLLARKGRFYTARPRYRYYYRRGRGSYIGSNSSPNRTTKVYNKLTNPCAKDIFEELESGVNYLKSKIKMPGHDKYLNFSEHILKLFKDSNKTHMTIKNANLGGDTAGYTDSKTNIITLSNSYLQKATRLSIARTMIHESVHAYMNGVYYKRPDLINKPLYYKMAKYANTKGYDYERFQHEFMGEFVNAMAYSLYEWDKRYGSGKNKRNITDPNQLLGWNYYYSMAFGGLLYEDKNGVQHDTNSFKALVPRKTDRDKIKQIIKNEQEGKSSAKGTKCI